MDSTKSVKHMSGKRGIPLLEAVVGTLALLALFVFAARQYKSARIKADAIVLGESRIRCTTFGPRCIHVYVDYSDFCDDDIDMLEPVGPFEDFNVAFTNFTPDGLSKLPWPDTITALNLTAMILEDDDVAVLSRFPNLQKLNLTATFVTDKGMSTLAELTQLTELSVQECRVTNEGIAELSALPKLETLNVAFSDVTPDGLDVLKDCSALSKVIVWPRPVPQQRTFDVEVARKVAEIRGVNRIRRPGSRTTVVDPLLLPDAISKRFRVLANAATRHPRIMHLALSNTDFSDADAAVLRRFRFLATLNLIETGIGDETLSELADHVHLWRLYLNSTAVTDAGLKCINRLPLLSHIDLRNTAVTDAGLWHLRRLPSLESLDLLNTRVTPEGVARLKELMPDLKVSLTQ